MKMALDRYFSEEKQRIIDTCTTCGKCVKTCDIVVRSRLAAVRPREIQAAVLDFLESGTDSPVLRDRISTCMQCYGCANACPEHLNPMQSLEICACDMAEKGLVSYPPWDPKSPDLVHRVLASIQTTAAEYDRIFTPTPRQKAGTLFFPGCNVYYQPEKLLNALDIMAVIDPEFAFLPGLDACCGNCHLTLGRPKTAGETFTELMEMIGGYEPGTLVLWCPTCFCLAETTFAPFTRFPFRILSMAQYVSENLDKVAITETHRQTVTLHDACKVALIGLDVAGARPILEKAGFELKEMDRSGKNAACCGCAAISGDPPSGNRMLKDRIDEAARTGAEILVTVCHYCNQVLASSRETTPFRVDNYINLLAAAMGIRRQDRFQTYMAWGNAEKIMADAAPFIASSPFSDRLIRETVDAVFCGG